MKQLSHKEVCFWGGRKSEFFFCFFFPLIEVLVGLEDREIGEPACGDHMSRGGGEEGSS